VEYVEALGQSQCIVLIELYEFHGDETPLSSDKTHSFNDPTKSAILLI